MTVEATTRDHFRDRRSNFDKPILASRVQRPGDVINDGTSCMAMHTYKDVTIGSRMLSPNQGNGYQPLIIAVINSEST